jgi:hypothetical protein
MPDADFGEGYIMFSIPDFFQDDSEEALRSQVEWQAEHLGLHDDFFTKLLREDSRTFSGWRRDRDALSRSKENVLRDWWQAILHLLSFQNFDEEKVRALLEQTASRRPRAEPSVFSPPWSESSLKEYLQRRGPDAIEQVNRWVESFRFGDPYAPHRKDSSCLSTQT